MSNEENFEQPYWDSSDEKPFTPQENEDLKVMIIDVVDDGGNSHDALTFTVDTSLSGSLWVFSTDPFNPLRYIGIIRQCDEEPEFIGNLLFEDVKVPEHKLLRESFSYLERYEGK